MGHIERTVKRMDRETTITHLQIIHTWAEFAHERDLLFFTKKHLENIAQWADDALELLKEQEAEIRQLRLALDIVKETCKGDPFETDEKFMGDL